LQIFSKELKMRLQLTNRIVLFFIFWIPVGFLQKCTISLKAPPITFTQTQTASEKQLVGEDREIEKDGWLISSIKSSSSGSELWKKDPIAGDSGNKNMILLHKKLLYYEPELRAYRIQGILGESYDGSIKFVPSKSILNKEELARVRELVSQINSTREEILEFLIRENPSLKIEELRNSQVQTRFRYLEYGEYFELEKNKWIRKE